MLMLEESLGGKKWFDQQKHQAEIPFAAFRVKRIRGALKNYRFHCS